MDAESNCLGTHCLLWICKQKGTPAIYWSNLVTDNLFSDVRCPHHHSVVCLGYSHFKASRWGGGRRGYCLHYDLLVVENSSCDQW